MTGAPATIRLCSVVEPDYVLRIRLDIYEAGGAPRCPWEEIMVPDESAPSRPAKKSPAEATELQEQTNDAVDA